MKTFYGAKNLINTNVGKDSFGEYTRREPEMGHRRGLPEQINGIMGKGSGLASGGGVGGGGGGLVKQRLVSTNHNQPYPAFATAIEHIFTCL